MAVETASLYARIGADVSGFKNGMSQVKSGLTSFGGQLTSIGKSAMKTGAVMSAALTAPIVAAGAKMFKSAAEFETGMNVMELAAKSSGTSLEDLRAAAIRVGGDTELAGINAAQAADAMTNFYKAGLQTNEIMGDLDAYLQGGTSLTGALRAAIDMAAASEYDLSAASEAVTVAMATFGIKAEDATKITDSFVRAADASVASVPELNDALVNIGSTFAAFYGNTMEGTESLNQLNTALAILSQRGIKGAEAGTALKSMMTNMMRQTSSVQDAWAALNVSLYDSKGQLKQLPTIIGELGQALSGLTEEERNQYIQTLAGTYGMKAMNTLLAEGTDGWAEMEKAIGDAATTQDAAGARTRGLGAAWENLKGVLETVILQGTSPLMETVTGVVRGLADLLSKLVMINPFWFKLAGGIALALAAAGPIVTAFGALATLLGFVLSPLGLVVAGVVALGVAWVKAQGGIKPAIETLKKALDIVKVAYAQFQGGGFGAVDFGSMFSGLADTLVPPDVMAAVQSAIGTITTFFTGLWAKVQPVLVAIGQILAATFGDTFAQAWASMQEAFAGLAPLWESLKALGAELAPILSVLAQAIGATLVTAIGILLGVFRGLVAGITTALPYIINAIQGWVQAFTGVIQLVTGLFQMLTAVIMGDTEAMSAAWERMKTGAINIFEGLKTSVINSVVGMVETVKATIGGFVDGIVGYFTNLYNQLIGHSIIPDMLNDIKAAFSGAVAEWLNAGKNMVAGMIDGVKQKAADLVNAAKGVVTDAIDAVRTALKSHSPSLVFAEIGADMMAGWANGISEAKSKVLKNVAEAAKDLISAFRKLLDITAVFGEPGEVPDLGAWMDKLEAMIFPLMARLQNLQDRIGYNRIQKLRHVAERLAKIFKAIQVDFSGITDLDLPNLDTFFASYEDVFMRLMAMLGRIATKWGTKAVEIAGTLADNVGSVLSLLSTSLQIGEISENFGLTLDAWLAAADIATEKLITKLMALRDKWGMEVLEAAGTIAGQIATVLALLGTNLNLEALNKGWLTTFTDWVEGFATATDLLIAKLTEMQSTLSTATIEGMAAFASSLGTLWSTIASSFEAIRGLIEGGGINVGTLQTLLNQWQTAAGLAASAAATPVAATAATTQSTGNTATGGTLNVGGGGEGVIKVHIMLGDQIMQEISLRLSQLLGTQQDIYVQAALDGAVH